MALGLPHYFCCRHISGHRGSASVLLVNFHMFAIQNQTFSQAFVGQTYLSICVQII